MFGSQITSFWYTILWAKLINGMLFAYDLHGINFLVLSVPVKNGRSRAGVDTL